MPPSDWGFLVIPLTLFFYFLEVQLEYPTATLVMFLRDKWKQRHPDPELLKRASDGRILLKRASDGRILIFDRKTGRPRYFLDAQRPQPTALPPPVYRRRDDQRAIMIRNYMRKRYSLDDPPGG